MRVINELMPAYINTYFSEAFGHLVEWLLQVFPLKVMLVCPVIA